MNSALLLISTFNNMIRKKRARKYEKKEREIIYIHI